MRTWYGKLAHGGYFACRGVANAFILVPELEVADFLALFVGAWLPVLAELRVRFAAGIVNIARGAERASMYREA